MKVAPAAFTPVLPPIFGKLQLTKKKRSLSDYRLSTKAGEDILDILAYSFSTFGETQTRSYFDGLLNSFTFLTENPRAARQRFEVQPPIRAYRYRSHLIIYEIDDMGIFILRVPHASMDWMGDL